MMKRVVLIVLVIAASVIFSAGQQAAPPGASDTNLRNQADPTKMRSNELERIKRDTSGARQKPAAEKTESKFPEIKEDFEELQKINNDKLQPAGQKTPLDHEVISQLAAEIKRRGVRLKSNLFAPEQKKQGKKDSKGKTDPPAEPQNLKELLIALDNALMRFVSSPIFQNSPTVDAQASLKAEKDLDEVIRASSDIVDQIGKMNPAPQK